jgi:hypothetical protein
MSITDLIDVAARSSALRPNSDQLTPEGGYERNSAFTMFPVLPFSCPSDAPILSR